MKKFLTLLLILGISILSFNLLVKAYDTTTLKGYQWDLSENGEIFFEFNHVNYVYEGQFTDRLYIKPEAYPIYTNFDYFDVDLQRYSTLPYINEYLTNIIGGSIVGFTPDTWTPIGIEGWTIETSIDSTPTDIENTGLNFFVIETSEGNYYLDNFGVDTLTFTFNTYVYVEYDVINEQNVIVDQVMTDIAINNVELTQFDDVSEGVQWIRTYFIDTIPSEQNWNESGGLFYWTGFGNESTYTWSQTGIGGGYPTFDYFDKYVERYIEPWTNDATDLSDRIDDYITLMQTTGITIDIPDNYGISLFDPEDWLNVVDPWYRIFEQVDTVVITFPDLALVDGDIEGETVVYTVDGESYTFYMTDGVNVDVPSFSLKIATDFKLVSFVTGGGTPEPSTQWIESGYTVIPPVDPSYTGYEFMGWTINNTVDQLQPWDTTYDFFSDLETFEIFTNRTFYAVYKESLVNITLNLNGGNMKPTVGFTGNILKTVYGDTVINNIYDVDFNDMVYRVGYGLVGWYQDEALTIPFNSSTPLTSNVTIYAKWSLGAIGEDSPTGLNAFMDSLGLLNPLGTFFAYLFVMILLFVPCMLLRLPVVIYTIISILLSALWLFLGWFNAWTMILIVLANAFLFFTTLRRE